MEVKKLIEAEMAAMPERDYLAKLQPPPTPYLDESPFFREAEARFVKGERLDTIKPSTLEAPQGPAGRQTGAWERAVSNANKMIGMQEAHALNIDLQNTLGKPAWVTHVPHVLATEKALTAQVTNLHKASEEVNKRRKLDQISTGNQLRSLQQRCEALERNTAEVEEATAMLGVDVRRTKQFAKERGVLPPEFLEDVDQADGDVEMRDA